MALRLCTEPHRSESRHRPCPSTRSDPLHPTCPPQSTTSPPAPQSVRYAPIRRPPHVRRGRAKVEQRCLLRGRLDMSRQLCGHERLKKLADKCRVPTQAAGVHAQNVTRHARIGDVNLRCLSQPLQPLGMPSRHLDDDRKILQQSDVVLRRAKVDIRVPGRRMAVQLSTRSRNRRPENRPEFRSLGHALRHLLRVAVDELFDVGRIPSRPTLTLETHPHGKTPSGDPVEVVGTHDL